MSIVEMRRQSQRGQNISPRPTLIHNCGVSDAEIVSTYLSYLVDNVVDAIFLFIVFFPILLLFLRLATLKAFLELQAY